MSEKLRPHPLGGPAYIDENGYVQLPKFQFDTEVSLCKTQSITAAFEAYRMFLRIMRAGEAFQHKDYPGKVLKINKVGMLSFETKPKTLQHEIKASVKCRDFRFDDFKLPFADDNTTEESEVEE